MSSCNITKTKAIMVVLVGLFGLLCVGFAVSVTEKYQLQKERVHGLERQLRAGRSEVLKIPALMQNLGEVKSLQKETEEKFTECAEEKGELAEQLSELQVEVDSFGAVKAAVGVQIGGLETVIQEQQEKIAEAEKSCNALAEQISVLEEEKAIAAEKLGLQLEDMKRGQEEVKNQLIYYTEAKKVADKELEEKQKAIEALKSELAALKEKAEEKSSNNVLPDFSKATESSASGTVSQTWDLGATAEELDKTFTLLRQRVTSPNMSLAEVSILLSRAEKALKELK